MKVLIVTNTLAPYRIELFRRVRELAPRIDLVVAVNSKTIMGRKWHLPSDLPFAYHVIPSIPFGGSMYKRYLAIVLPRLFQRLSPDVVVSSEFSLSAISTFLCCKHLCIPYICWTDGTSSSEKDFGRLRRMLRRYIIPRSKAVIVSSLDGIEHVREYGVLPQNIFLSVLTGDKDAFRVIVEQERPRRQAVRREWGFDEKYIFVYVGFLAEHKGISDLMNAFWKVQKIFANVGLILIGDGPLREDVCRFIAAHQMEGSVKMLGYVPFPEIVKYFVASDCLILPSRREPFGLVLGEAATAGLSIIASSNVGSAKHFISVGINGMIYNGSVEELEKAMLYVIRTILPAEAKIKSEELASFWSLDNAAIGFINALKYAYQTKDKSAD